MEQKFSSKAEYRKHAKELRAKVQDRSTKERAICQHLIDFSSGRTGVVAVYFAVQTEVNLDFFTQGVFLKGGSLAAPFCDGDRIRFCLVRSNSDLTVSSMGIREPALHIRNSSESEVFPPAISMMCVPGLLFDSHGNRLGYGKGYYDRYFSESSCFFKLGIAFDEQIVDGFPVHPLDAPMDALLSPSRLVIL